MDSMTDNRLVTSFNRNCSLHADRVFKRDESTLAGKKSFSTKIILCC